MLQLNKESCAPASGLLHVQTRAARRKREGAYAHERPERRYVARGLQASPFLPRPRFEPRELPPGVHCADNLALPLAHTLYLLKFYLFESHIGALGLIFGVLLVTKLNTCSYVPFLLVGVII